jgi:hypothetical protein
MHASRPHLDLNNVAVEERCIHPKLNDARGGLSGWEVLGVAVEGGVGDLTQGHHTGEGKVVPVVGNRQRRG